MNQDSKPHNPFSLIADFDGDIRDLFAHRRDGELPILPLRNLVLFPGVVTTVTIGRESSMALIRHITNQTDDEGYFAVATQVDAEVESPQFDDLYPVGTLAKLLRVIELPDQKNDGHHSSLRPRGVARRFHPRSAFHRGARDLSS